jgi:acetyl/propionyl-CoA carboxylase alpha subunit
MAKKSPSAGAQAASGAPIKNLLVANRGEIAIRIMRAASALGLQAAAMYPQDDADSLHTKRADRALLLAGTGVSAYLNIDAVVELAVKNGCDAVHPGYGFLSENADFARRCAAAGVRFVGPRPELLELFGDKSQARDAARKHGVPVIPGTHGATTLEEMQAFFASLGGAPMVIKALAGGGGRGIRVVRKADEISDAYARCCSEALSAFGNGSVYAERLIARARHIEIQILGDGTGAVAHLGERDCTVQRRHQKLVEIAPSPALTDKQRADIIAAAVQFAAAVKYDNIGTFEFLVDEDRGDFAFIEANPRLQVEHTVTEAVTGVDIVQTQLQLAMGRSLKEVGLDGKTAPAARGYAIQLRVNAETMAADGTPIPSGGTLAAFDAPSGPGLRTDTYGYAGYRINPRYDSLLAKVIVHSPVADFAVATKAAYRALSEFRIDGVNTNVAFLQALLQHADVPAAKITTRWLDEVTPALLDAAAKGASRLHFESVPAAAAAAPSAKASAGPEGTSPLNGSMQGTVVMLAVKDGDVVRAGQPVVVLEAMKLEHEIAAHVSGTVRRIDVAAGDVVYEGQALLHIEEGDVSELAAQAGAVIDPFEIRPALQEVIDRHAKTLDAARPAEVARHHARGERTARENVADLFDEGSFIEYGGLIIAAQRLRRPLQELIDKTPHDGIVTGLGRINGDRFPESASRAAVLAYDYTVLAGTQGQNNHRKTDRMIDVAKQLRLPVVLFSTGGGGRPGDTDFPSGYDSNTFTVFPQLSGLVPLVGINSGPCFAGNTGLLGVCDVIIATRNSSIGMGGPAMVEGGGLGVYKTEEIGPIDVQSKNGVVDIVVADEAEGVRVAKKYLSYFQGPLEKWTCADQRALRTALPSSRLRGYHPRKVIELMADTDSFLELRKEFGIGITTGFMRIEGRPMGVLANNPNHLGGAIDSDASDKAARFMMLCDAFDIPVVSLVDNPGIMVGPEAEKTALVRHSSRLFLVGSNLSVPFFSIVLRKVYGLGGVAMYGGNAKTPLFTIAWPSGEFGNWGIEASVRLGYRKEMAAIADEAERKRFYDEKVAEQYRDGTAINTASRSKIDDVIDPADTRLWLASLLKSLPPLPVRTGKKRSMVDAW